MTTKNDTETLRDLDILQQIEKNPDFTQATLADQLGVAVGTVNWHVKRLVDKGYVKIQRCERRKLKYLITPDGINLISKLTLDYIHTSFELYRLIRARMNAVLDQIDPREKHSIRIIGSGDMEEICRLTCLERGYKVISDADDDVPVVRINGLKLFLENGEGDK